MQEKMNQELWKLQNMQGNTAEIDKNINRFEKDLYKYKYTHSHQDGGNDIHITTEVDDNFSTIPPHLNYNVNEYENKGNYGPGKNYHNYSNLKYRSNLRNDLNEPELSIDLNKQRWQPIDINGNNYKTNYGFD